MGEMTPALYAANRRASFTPVRIVVGQIGINHKQARILVKVGFWEMSEIELCKGKATQRYRITEAGRRAALIYSDQRPAAIP